MEGEGGAGRRMLWLGPLGGFMLVFVGCESNDLEKSRPDRVGNGFFSLVIGT